MPAAINAAPSVGPLIRGHADRPAEEPDRLAAARIDDRDADIAGRSAARPDGEKLKLRVGGNGLRDPPAENRDGAILRRAASDPGVEGGVDPARVDAGES